jgi:MoaA/NifB/PqqE/SkfB family radical SAM enzyme
MWTLRDDPQMLSGEERRALVCEFAAMSPGGEVVLTGGETMRDKEAFFSLTRLCRELGLRSAANTNGSYITRDDDDRLLAEGPTYLVFSLDSHDAAIHDYNRGIDGSCETTIATMKRLLAAKARLGAPTATEIMTNSVLLEGNIRSLFELLDALAEIPVDGALLQVLSPTFHRRGEEDVFYQRNFFRDRAAAVEILQRLIRRIGDYPILRTTATDLRWMQRYILLPEVIDEGICGSHEKNIMVDHRGEVQLCFNMRKIFDGRSIGNTRSSGLVAMWTGSLAGQARDVMAGCRKSCGMLNCHRRQN